MAEAGDYYVVEVLEPHINWGIYKHSTDRQLLERDSYVKIPSKDARRLQIVRKTKYTARFENGQPSMLIKASGNGPYQNGIQYAKQFEGVGDGACKAFTPWYVSCDIQVGDLIKVEFLSPTEILFTKL